MTVYAGNDGVVKVGSNALTKVLSFELNEEESTSDRTDGMGEEWEDSIGIKKRWAGSLECRRNDADANGPVTWDVGDVLALKLYPDGDGVGRQELAGSARVTSIGNPVDMESTNRISVEFTGQGALTKTTVSA
ncbi:hypothetical protein [Mesorhizobium sp. J428]|uniref:hypothetical protein n=1 Tax=Mesorhizobium sp. J428 TaxID=2898440 RepID=UPI0021508AB2|nr:hypothetical protein [Mesorhizobium sp. J428]MCR5859724.1 hypothetical protein [Mesorhizobium sp. J428]